MMEYQSVRVHDFVQHKLTWLLSMPGDGPQKAMLANLRRGIGREPGDLPEIWGLLFQDMPEELLGKDTEASRGEWACYTAITLFALHQQSIDPRREPMTQKGMTLGKAMQHLIPMGDESALERVRRRFNAVATAADMFEISYHLRGVVQLLRTAGIPLDYPALASDLYRYQFPEAAAGVRLMWGRDFYFTRKSSQSERETDVERKDV